MITRTEDGFILEPLPPGSPFKGMLKGAVISVLGCVYFLGIYFLRLWLIFLAVSIIGPFIDLWLSKKSKQTVFSDTEKAIKRGKDSLAYDKVKYLSISVSKSYLYLHANSKWLGHSIGKVGANELGEIKDMLQDRFRDVRVRSDKVLNYVFISLAVLVFGGFYISIAIDTFSNVSTPESEPLEVRQVSGHEPRNIEGFSVPLPEGFEPSEDEAEVYYKSSAAKVVVSIVSDKHLVGPGAEDPIISRISFFILGLDNLYDAMDMALSPPVGMFPLMARLLALEGLELPHVGRFRNGDIRGILLWGVKQEKKGKVYKEYLAIEDTRTGKAIILISNTRNEQSSGILNEIAGSITYVGN